MGVNRCSWGPCSREEKYASTTINHPGVLFLVKDKKHKENEESIPTQMTTGAGCHGKAKKWSEALLRGRGDGESISAGAKAMWSPDNSVSNVAGA